VLKQISQTTDPDALWRLAEALQALAQKLTEAQASQTLDPVLKQICQTTDPGALSFMRFEPLDLHLGLPPRDTLLAIVY
jgi:hypothetical protein